MRVCLLPYLSRTCLNRVLKPASHQTSGKQRESVQRSNDERKTEHSIPGKLMESCAASNITNHVVTQNLLDNRQWAYRKGKSTEQLLIHLTERWREAVERKLFVGILFVDFTKAFDTVSHNITTKAELPRNQRRYLAVVKELPYRTKTFRQNKRMRLTEYRKGWSSDNNIILYRRNDGFANNTLNSVLAELQEWCDRNSMVPHTEKCKAMIM